MKDQAPRTRYVPVEDWIGANRVVKEFVAGQPYTLGSGTDYPDPFALFYKDALSGEGMGYHLWKTRERQLHELYAHIDIVGKRDEGVIA